MKIVYAGEMEGASSSPARARALERLSHEVICFPTDRYRYSSRVLNQIAYRLVAGPQVSALNRDLEKLTRDVRPDIFWSDKVLSVTSRTLKHMRQLGVRTVSYVIDNPFGPRRDPGWRLYMNNIPLFDLHVTQRDVSVQEYMRRGARNAIKIQTAFEPTMHFPPPGPIHDAERTRGVSFIGTPYDNRAEIFTGLAQMGLPIVISGSPGPWQRALSPEVFEQVFRDGVLYDDRYREAIWHSKINISFITHSNQDEYTQKSFEIAGCEGFLLCERSGGHALKFEEDREAVFFDGLEELARKIQQYLPDEAARTRIARAGRERAVRDGYDNDSQMQRIVAAVQQLP